MDFGLLSSPSIKPASGADLFWVNIFGNGSIVSDLLYPIFHSVAYIFRLCLRLLLELEGEVNSMRTSGFIKEI